MRYQDIVFNCTDEEIEEASRLYEVERERERLVQHEADREAERAREEQAASEARRREAMRGRRRQQDRYELPFVPTTVSNLVADLIGRCLRFGQNGLIIGAPGVGKTRALQEAVRRSADGAGPEVGLVTVSAVVGASTMAVFEEVCPHLGVEPASSIAATMRRLCREADYAPVLLFDEAQNLSLKSARELLAISEQARVQMVFCGNGDVLKLVSSRQAAIQQISRRLPHREDITCIADDDADLIAGQFGVEGMEAFRLCRRIGNRFHADGIAKVLTVARENVAGRKTTLDLADVEGALALMPHFDTLDTDRGQPRRQSSMRPT